MWRWLAYSGAPLLLEDVIIKPVHSLIDQSLEARLGPIPPMAMASVTVILFGTAT